MASRRAAHLVVEEQMRTQTRAGDLEYAFAPLKQARLDYMAQKAAEMGAAKLVPVLTRRTQVRLVSTERLRANAIEAAEQCGILTIPAVAETLSLDAYLAGLSPNHLLIFCDEDAEIADPVAALQSARRTQAGESGRGGMSLLIGPEGGFDDAERKSILNQSNVLRLSLGPRVLRADTAAVAALALIQATVGDWR